MTGTLMKFGSFPVICPTNFAATIFMDRTGLCNDMAKMQEIALRHVLMVMTMCTGTVAVNASATLVSQKNSGWSAGLASASTRQDRAVQCHCEFQEIALRNVLMVAMTT